MQVLPLPGTNMPVRYITILVVVVAVVVLQVVNLHCSSLVSKTWTLWNNLNLVNHSHKPGTSIYNLRSPIDLHNFILVDKFPFFGHHVDTCPIYVRLRHMFDGWNIFAQSNILVCLTDVAILLTWSLQDVNVCRFQVDIATTWTWMSNNVVLIFQRSCHKAGS